MFSVAPNILLAPNMTQNAERKHRTQNTNTAHFRSSTCGCDYLSSSTASTLSIQNLEIDLINVIKNLI